MNLNRRSFLRSATAAVLAAPFEKIGQTSAYAKEFTGFPFLFTPFTKDLPHPTHPPGRIGTGTRSRPTSSRCARPPHAAESGNSPLQMAAHCGDSHGAALASNVLPVPLSPVIKTLISNAAALRTLAKSSFVSAAPPTKPMIGCCSVSADLSSLFSASAVPNRTAELTRAMTSSALKGFPK